MTPLVSEKPMLEKYDQCGVSAVREFPQADVGGEGSVYNSDNVTNTEHLASDCADIVNKKTLSVHESAGDKSVHVVLEAGELELTKDVHSIDDLVNLSKSLESTDFPGEFLLPRSCDSLETLQVNAESVTKNSLCGTEESSKDLIDEKLKLPGLVSTIEGLEVRDGDKIFADSNLVQSSKKIEKGATKGRESKKKIVYRRDKGEKKRKRKIIYSEDEEGGVSVQGLMDAVDSQSREVDVSLPPLSASCSVDGGARSKVRERLRLFQAVTRKLLQEEETNQSKLGQGRGRIDRRALAIFKNKGKHKKIKESILGRVVGVEVGDEFHYRFELMIVGLHRLPQGGIDCLKEGETVVATSIVESGGYDNTVDNSDVFIYTGQGEGEDQKLERGNLALKNSIDKKNPVRVIRGVKDTNPSSTSGGKPKISTTYTYYGLYTVERYWKESGKSGNQEFKFELKRLPGQPALIWKEVNKSKKFREGLCKADVSDKKEKFPVCAVNTIDCEKPPLFEYIRRMEYPDWCNPSPPQGCDCKNGCSNSNQCSCATKNGWENPYNFDRAIVAARPLVYECGPSCKCPPSCYNRVSQRGIRFKLEIFKTERRGWGVRSLSSIPSGSFICEYTGKLLRDKDADQRTGNDEYLFDTGQNYHDHSLWEGLKGLIPEAASNSNEAVADLGFTIDAEKTGNVARFINHSCSPNLYAQHVLYDHDDTRVPHVMLFACENIPPLQELSYHYNYAVGELYDADGNVKVKNCYCGSSECTGRLY